MFFVIFIMYYILFLISNMTSLHNMMGGTNYGDLMINTFLMKQMNSLFSSDSIFSFNTINCEKILKYHCLVNLFIFVLKKFSRQLNRNQNLDTFVIVQFC